jgi:pyruvate dehydrogenase complex dehydrogenase (E1) component
MVRWNAIAIIMRANKASSELGGHIASFQSAATLYDAGFMHFWHGATEAHGGDLVYMQGHSSPGFYARAFLEGRLTEEQLLGFRQEAAGGGLSSYPHPWLMPDFWAVPEVAILGVVRSKMAPVWNGESIVPRLMLPLSLSYDHRVVDGALAARFTRQLCYVLEDVRRLVL